NLASRRPALGRRIRVRCPLLRSVPRLVLARRTLVEIENQAAPLQPVLAPVDADARQPCLEGRALPERVQALIRAKEALLRRAVRLSPVTEEAIGHSRDLFLVLPDEILEQLRVPGADFPDEPRLVGRRRRLAGDHGQSGHMRLDEDAAARVYAREAVPGEG